MVLLDFYQVNPPPVSPSLTKGRGKIIFRGAEPL